MPTRSRRTMLPQDENGFTPCQLFESLAVPTMSLATRSDVFKIR